METLWIASVRWVREPQREEADAQMAQEWTRTRCEEDRVPGEGDKMGVLFADPTEPEPPAGLAASFSFVPSLKFLHNLRPPLLAAISLFSASVVCSLAQGCRVGRTPSLSDLRP